MIADWNKVYREYEMNKGSGTESRGILRVCSVETVIINFQVDNFNSFLGGSVVTYYQATSTSPSLQSKYINSC